MIPFLPLRSEMLKVDPFVILPEDVEDLPPWPMTVELRSGGSNFIILPGDQAFISDNRLDTLFIFAKNGTRHEVPIRDIAWIGAA